MDTNALNFADLDDLFALLRDAGVRSVSVDPAEVNTPGIWCRVDGVSLDQLAGLTIKTTLHLVVPNTDPKRALTALADLFNTVAPVLRGLGGPTGDTLRVGLELPGAQGVCPALAVPLDLLTTQET